MIESGFSLEVKNKIKSFYESKDTQEKSLDPQTLPRIKKDFPTISHGLRQKLGPLYSDIDLFYKMVVHPAFPMEGSTRSVATATLLYFLYPSEVTSLGAALLGVVDDTLVIALAAKQCRSDLERFIKEDTAAKESPG